MIKTLFRTLGASLLALLILTPSAFAQTATTTTTLAAAISDSSSTAISLTSATDVNAGGKLYIDRESMDVVSVNSTIARVRRGMDGTRAIAHISGSVVIVASLTQKTGVFRSLQARGGTCTRANEAFLPQVDVPSGIIWDCPVGSTLWAPINFDINTARSEAFNLDNGAGTTKDALLMRNPRAIQITACRVVYQDVTSGTVAAATVSVGTTVGGVDIVAATAYENAKAVGTTTALVVANGKIAAATPVLVRHTGVAATAVGEAVVECDYVIR